MRGKNWKPGSIGIPLDVNECKVSEDGDLLITLLPGSYSVMIDAPGFTILEEKLGLARLEIAAFGKANRLGIAIDLLRKIFWCNIDTKQWRTRLNTQKLKNRHSTINSHGSERGGKWRTRGCLDLQQEAGQTKKFSSATVKVEAFKYCTPMGQILWIEM